MPFSGVWREGVLILMVPVRKENREEKRQRRKQYYNLLGYSAVGLEMGFAIAIGSIGGYYLDEWLVWTKPWLTLTGMFLGTVAAGKALWRVANQLKREIDKLEKEKEENNRDR